MPGFVERFMGWQEQDAKIPVHAGQAILAEFARGNLTGAQAQAAVVAVSGAPLTAAEITEAQALIGSITGTAAAKLARVSEIDHVLLLAEARAPGYDTPALVRARLGL